MAAVAPAQQSPDPRQELAARHQSGARWFFWIAALSVLNSTIALFSGGWQFIFGLGITQVFDGLGQGLADGAGGAAWGVRLAFLGLSVGAAAFYALFGRLAVRGSTTGFAAGMACYTVDALIFLLAGDILGLGFHAFALVGMGRGFAAWRKLKDLPAVGPRSETATPTAGTPEAEATAIAEAVEEPVGA